jgi:hypothetical protein
MTQIGDDMNDNDLGFHIIHSPFREIAAATDVAVGIGPTLSTSSNVGSQLSESSILVGAGGQLDTKINQNYYYGGGDNDSTKCCDGTSSVGTGSATAVGGGAGGGAGFVGGDARSIRSRSSLGNTSSIGGGTNNNGNNNNYNSWDNNSQFDNHSQLTSPSLAMSCNTGAGDSTKAQYEGQYPRARKRRKTLTDALQQINLVDRGTSTSQDFDDDDDVDTGNFGRHDDHDDYVDPQIPEQIVGVSSEPSFIVPPEAVAVTTVPILTASSRLGTVRFQDVWEGKTGGGSSIASSITSSRRSGRAATYDSPRDAYLRHKKLHDKKDLTSMGSFDDEIGFTYPLASVDNTAGADGRAANSSMIHPTLGILSDGDDNGHGHFNRCAGARDALTDDIVDDAGSQLTMDDDVYDNDDDTAAHVGGGGSGDMDPAMLEQHTSMDSLHHQGVAIEGSTKVIVENLEGVKSTIDPCAKSNDVTEKMTDDDDHENDEYDDDKSDPTAHLTEIQMAERAVMLDLIMGKNKPKKNAIHLFTAGASSEPSKCSLTKDPVQQKIEELMRQSLENVKKGAHPLHVKTSKPDDDDDTPISVWNDDMAVDPSVYHYRAGPSHGQGSSIMMTDDDGADGNNNGASGVAVSNTFYVPFRQRKRSNSISNATMDMDNDDTNFGNPYSFVGGSGGAGALAPFTASNSKRAVSSSDMDMEI